MKTKSALRINFNFIVIVLVSLLLWVADVSAQRSRLSADRGDERSISPSSSSTSAMAISPDSKYLYLFHTNKIYQFELPGLTLIKSVEVAITGRPKRQSSRKRDFIKDFDMDNDGRVSKEEFTGPSNIFKRLDINNNGYVDMSEVPK